MPRPKLRLTVSEETRRELDQRFRAAASARDRIRLHAIRLAVGGEHTYEEIASTVECARSCVQEWVGKMRSGGIPKLLAVGKARGNSSPIQRPEVLADLQAGLAAGRWRTAGQVADFLREKHGIKRNPLSLYYWLGKLNGTLKVPRPVNIKKDPLAAAAFKEHLEDRLHALNVPPGRRVRVWVQDETRYGCHTLVRRLWGLRGVRIVVPHQHKYQWGYIYGALEVVSGEAEFFFSPTVNLGVSQTFLQQIADSDPEAEHVVIWDGAGFHQRPGHELLPAHVHIVMLPGYSPELNPIEKLWDILKDGLCNKIFANVEAIESTLIPILQNWSRHASDVLRLVGNGWMHTQANAS